MVKNGKYMLQRMIRLEKRRIDGYLMETANCMIILSQMVMYSEYIDIGYNRHGTEFE